MATTVFGLTTEGFVPMLLPDIRDEMNRRIWDEVSPFLDLSDRSLEGQLVGIISELLSRAWEATEASNSSIDPDKALDAALDAICILTGTTRRGATYSQVELVLTGDDATPISALSAVRVPGTVDRYDTQAPVTIEGVDAWASLTTYEIGARVTLGGQVYQAKIGGISASTGPVGTDPLSPEVDGTVTWRFLGEGVAAVDVLAMASVTGTVTANSGTITEIVTPVGGWHGVCNILDVTPGRPQMTNPQLRVLRELELAKPGTSPADAIRAALLDDGTEVTAATIFMNLTDTVDGDGIPAKAVEALVTGGVDQDIWDLLRLNVAAGIRTHGTVIGTSTDSQGNEQTMKFSRPDDRPVYVAITCEVDPKVFPVDGVTKVKEAIVEWGRVQAAGKNAVASRIGAAAFEVDGVLDTPIVYIGFAPSPVASTTLEISLREQGTYDTSQIEVVTINGIP